MSVPEPSHPFALYRINDPAAVGLSASHAGDVLVTVESLPICDGERVTVLTDPGTASLLESAAFELGMADVPLNASAILGIARGWPADWATGAVEWLDWTAEEAHHA